MERIKYDEKKFQKMVDDYSPSSHIVKDCVKAFMIGGFICTLGQVISSISKYYGADKEMSNSITTISLIIIAATLTGLGLYEKIAKFAGAGTIVPITGFANTVVASAIEFKKEGYVFGVGAKMFTFAGPVIVYGVSMSVVVGLIYYLFK